MGEKDLRTTQLDSEDTIMDRWDVTKDGPAPQERQQKWVPRSKLKALLERWEAAYSGYAVLAIAMPNR